MKKSTMRVCGSPLTKAGRISGEAFGAKIHDGIPINMNDTSNVCDLILKAMVVLLNRFETITLYRSSPDLEILTTMVVVR